MKIEERKLREEEEKNRKVIERERKIKEIQESTDPSMDEMGVSTIMIPFGDGTPRIGTREIKMSKREALLSELGEGLGQYEKFSKWKSNKQIEDERKIEEERKLRVEEEKNRKEIERARKIKEIQESTDPNMYEMGVSIIRVPLGDGTPRMVTREIKMSKREALLSELGEGLGQYEKFSKWKSDKEIEDERKIEAGKGKQS